MKIDMLGWSGGRQEFREGARLPDNLKPTALRYALGLAGVSVVVGIHDETELAQNLAWAKAHRPLTAEELKALDRSTRELAGKWGSVYGKVV